MTIADFMKLVGSNPFRIRSARTGKVYFQTWTNTRSRLDRYRDRKICYIKPELRLPHEEYYENYVYPIITVYIEENSEVEDAQDKSEA